MQQASHSLIQPHKHGLCVLGWLLLGLILSLLVIKSAHGHSENLASGNNGEITLTTQASRLALGHHVLYLEDTSKKLTAKEALTAFNKGLFSQPNSPALQFGYTDSAIWLAVNVNNASNTQLTRAIEVAYAPLDSIEIFMAHSNGEVQKLHSLGDHKQFHLRPVLSRSYIAPLEIPANKQQTLLLRIHTTSSLTVPLSLADMVSLYEFDHSNQLLLGVFYGIAIGLFFYNLFLFFSTRKPIYCVYVLYIASYSLFMASLDGLLYPLWPDAISWESRSIYFFVWSSFLFLSIFCRKLLNTQKDAPKINGFLIALEVIYVLALAYIVYTPNIALVAKVNSPGVLLCTSIIYVAMVIRLIQGSTEAVYALLGMTSLFFGLLAVAGGALNLHSHYLLAPLLLKVGAAIEMILFSIALARTINTLESKTRRSIEEANRANAEAEAQARHSEKMDEVNLQLAHAVKARTDFLANMSHEIRTPMNGILGMVELVKGTELTEKQTEYLEVAHRSGKTLLILINDILDLSKIEAGKLELESLDFSLDDIIKDLKALYALQLQDKGLYFNIERSESLSNWIIGDRTRIWQILNNLISNALKFTQEGGVTLSLTTQDDRMIITVADTGIGISKAAQASIFDSFTQADSSTTRKFGGTGLGLTISKKLAEMMGGNIQLESEPGQGTSFTLNLPLIVGNAPSKEDHTCVHSGVVYEDFHGLNVLLVEDNAINQLVAEEMLESLQISSEHAQDGLVAIQKASEKTYDLIFMDMQMPNCDGLEATQRIIESTGPNANTPIIAMTANAMHEDKIRCEAAGMKDHLSKPIDIDSLRDMIIKWMNKAP